MKRAAACAALMLAVASAFAATPEVISPESAQWLSPPTLPGVQGAWLVGGESKPGLYVFRVKMAKGARIPPHTHPDERTTTVLGGTLHVGFGETFDESSMVAISAGSVYTAPANVSHYLWAREGEAMYQESGIGPTGTNILRKAAARPAPDEALLGKAEGYPLCAPSLRIEPRCIVGLVSRRDEVSPSRKVARGQTVRPLAHASVEPVIRYRYQGELAGLDDYLARHRTTGLLVLRGDTVLAERYQYERTPQHRMTSMSMAKTVVAMLVGVALADGSIASLEDRADAYVPDLKGTAYGDTTIRDLLTMSSGIRFSEVYSGADDVAMLARLSILGESEGGAATVRPFATREWPPGERFHYASSDTQVLGLVLRHATGKPLADYLSERIWQPMGAEADASWLVDKGGYEAAFSGFNATLRDYARFGMLLANGGAVEGRQLIPEAWVRAATTALAPRFSRSAFVGYGYQTWVLPQRDQFALRGIRSQALFVDPRTKVVLVHTAAGRVGEPTAELLALWRDLTHALAR